MKKPKPKKPGRKRSQAAPPAPAKPRFDRTRRVDPFAASMSSSMILGAALAASLSKR